MGQSLSRTCSWWEVGHWDPHAEISNEYTPAPTAHDMTRPLSNYFVSSGHNSYLTTDQLLGASGTATIIMCLKAACRVIELDCYNGPKGPICKHGGTATAPILFEECIVAIKTHAFTASPYPVIITLENHADETGQTQMVEILTRQLGALLYVPSPEDTKDWKSPEALRNKILMRANTGKAVDALKKIVYIANTKFPGFESMNQLDHVTSSSLVESKIDSFGKKLDITREAGKLQRAETKRSKSGKLGSKKNSSFLKSSSKKLEGGAEEADDDVPAGPFTLEDAFKYSSRHLLRVYPAGWRVGSGNYDPTLAWCLGASFVALNWQAVDKAIWLNQGKFQDNHGCGYVLKPDWMLKGQAPQREPRTLNVHVYSAHVPQGFNCMCGKDDLLVSLEVRGWYMDCDKQKTDYIQDSGRLKVDKTFSFSVLCPEMAVLLLVLQDYDTGNANDPLAYSSLSLATLVPGKYNLPMQQVFVPASPTSSSKVAELATGCWVKVGLSWGDANPLRDH